MPASNIAPTATWPITSKRLRAIPSGTPRTLHFVGSETNFAQLTIHPIWRFFREYFIYSGWERDGRAGLVVALLSASSAVMKYAHLQELEWQTAAQTAPTAEDLPLPFDPGEAPPESWAIAPIPNHGAVLLTFPILSYHKVQVLPAAPGYLCNYVLPAAFEEQMSSLAKWGYTPITIEQWIEIRDGRRRPPQRPIAITFDDGYRSTYGKCLACFAPQWLYRDRVFDRRMCRRNESMGDNRAARAALGSG